MWTFLRPYDFFGEYPDKWTPYGQSLINQSLSSKREVFYTGAGRLSIDLGNKEFITKPYYVGSDKYKIYDGKNLKLSESQNSDGDHLNKIENSENEIKDYLYRLEKNILYQ
jgi:hypothetical protein